MNIIKAEQIKVGTQLAEADGFLWDVVEIIKETPSKVNTHLRSLAENLCSRRISPKFFLTNAVPLRRICSNILVKYF